MNEQTTIAEAIEQATDARLREVYTLLNGRVTAVNGNTVDVQPIPADWLNGEVIALPELSAVPMLRMRGGGGSVYVPVAVGDYVQLRFPTRSLARFISGDGEGDPQTLRMHHLSDAVAEPFGVWPDSDTPPTTKAVALDGDSVASGTLTITTTPTVPPDAVPGVNIIFTYTNPDGASMVQVIKLFGLLTGAGSGAPAVITGDVSASAITEAS